MKKRTLAILLTGLLAGILGCADEKSQMAKDAGGKGDNDSNPQKPTEPPSYRIEQFKVGQTYTWRKGKSADRDSCTQWVILAVDPNLGIEVEDRYFLRCGLASPADTTRFRFNPYDGVIIKGEAEGSAWARLFGSQKQQKIKRMKKTMPWGQVQIFQPEESKSWYVEAPGTYLQGVLLADESLVLVDFSTPK